MTRPLEVIFATHYFASLREKQRRFHVKLHEEQSRKELIISLNPTPYSLHLKPYALHLKPPPLLLQDRSRTLW